MTSLIVSRSYNTLPRIANSWSQSLTSIVVGEWPFVIAGSPLNMCMVGYIHRVDTLYIRYVYIPCMVCAAACKRQNSQKWRPPTTMLTRLAWIGLVSSLLWLTSLMGSFNTGLTDKLDWASLGATHLVHLMSYLHCCPYTLRPKKSQKEYPGSSGTLNYHVSNKMITRIISPKKCLGQACFGGRGALVSFFT